jgi:hypothetical protein
VPKFIVWVDIPPKSFEVITVEHMCLLAGSRKSRKSRTKGESLRLLLLSVAPSPANGWGAGERRPTRGDLSAAPRRFEFAATDHSVALGIRSTASTSVGGPESLRCARSCTSCDDSESLLSTGVFRALDSSIILTAITQPIFQCNPFYRNNLRSP